MVSQTASPSVDDVVAGLERDGYAIVPHLLSPGEAAEKRAELSRVLAATPTGRNDFEGFKTQRIYALFAKTGAFDGPATRPLVLGVLDRVLGPSYQLSAPVGIQIGPGEKAQVLHCDHGIYPLPRAVRRSSSTPCGRSTISPRRTARPVSSPAATTGWSSALTSPRRRSVPRMPAGSVLFFTGSVYHGGGANRTDKPRLGTILEYVVGWLRPQENHTLAVPREMAKTLSPRLQELLGYNIHPPFMGYVDGRHPRKVLEE